MYIGIFDNYRVRNLKLKGNNKILIRIFDRYEFIHDNIENIDEYNDVLELYIRDISKYDEIIDNVWYMYDYLYDSRDKKYEYQNKQQRLFGYT